MEQLSSAKCLVLPVREWNQMSYPWFGAISELHNTSVERFSDVVGEEVETRVKGDLLGILTSFKGLLKY